MTLPSFGCVLTQHFEGTLPNHRNPIGIRNTVLSVSAADFRNSPGAINEIPQLMDR